MATLSQAQIEAYGRDGFIVVEGVLDAAELAELRRVTEDLVAQARHVTAHTDIYDLEDSHSPQAPRVRRIKNPTAVHPVYDRVMRHPRILAILQDLIGPAIRFDVAKLNMKAAGYGAAVEWHQDWAFYPHTNDDLCAVGVMMDDCALENGPLLCIPGSHKGPVHDHHADGVFCGAIDPSGAAIDFAAAVPCVGPAGSISIHHARTIHGSAVNTSTRDRRLLLFQYRAADAWPLCAHNQTDWGRWNELLLTGHDQPIVPRMTAVPVRLPLPPAKSQGSIYENQRGLKTTFFGTAEKPKAAALT